MSEIKADPYSLLWSLRYDDAILAARQRLNATPDDLEAVGILASALIATREYEQAIPYVSRLDEVERADPIASGRPGQQLQLACLNWMLGKTMEAITSMRELANGILDRSIEYSDNAGGVTQGNLLYYMAVSAGDKENVEFALSYLQGRAKLRAIQFWPGPVARHYLNKIDFEDVLVAATGERSLERATSEAKANLRKRRDLCVALFHDGVRMRALGRDAECLERMKQCYALPNPVIESEWYLARHELERAEGI